MIQEQSANKSVVTVHNIASAAAGWRFTHNSVPVVCFALVTVAAPMTMFRSEVVVIPLGPHDLANDLVGREIDPAEIGLKFIG
jgi:hypothetical protein